VIGRPHCLPVHGRNLYSVIQGLGLAYDEALFVTMPYRRPPRPQATLILVVAVGRYLPGTRFG